MAEERETLESVLNKATNPAQRDEDWDFIMAFCDKVNHDLEGPQFAVRLLAHKIQSPQERESLFALTTLEACVKNCGRRFHQEIGKFRFLNEIIKVVSPKYLGSKTTEKVKKRCIEILYSWSKGLTHECKIQEAYTMLKTQGIVKEDPTYVDTTFEIPPERPRNAVFEDDEKAKLLSKLLKSKNPDDLQAANRLIKNMVKEDAAKSEKISRRINELETISNNVKLLTEMMSIYDKNTTTQAEKDMMKELHATLEKLRPNLFRLASDVDEKDSDGINDILKANDTVMKTMGEYKSKVEGIHEEGDWAHGKDASSLLDLNFEPSPSRAARIEQSATSTSTAILEGEFQALGLDDKKVSGTQASDSSVLSELDDIFGAAAQQPVSKPPQPALSQAMSTAGMFASGTAPVMGAAAPFPVMVPAMGQQPGFSPFGQLQQPVAPAVQGVQASSASTGVSSQKVPVTAMADLDLLGQNLLQQSLGGKDQRNHFPPQQTTPKKMTMNQLAAVSAGSQSAPGTQPTLLLLANQNSSSQSTAILNPVGPGSAVSQELLPLTDIFVPLENIKPATDMPPVTAYDKNSVKTVIHFATDKPRSDVLVMVLSTLSTNTSPIKKFVFQAAVPKVMKVKLQPPSASDLPAYNPILPPAAITQVMLIANPKREKIRLKYKVTYILDENNVTDTGDIDAIPSQ
ncbi:ADP-ribosylation factor-binding protein GGA1-like isoform X2 [Haliotis rufescens]|uniref:ADP-ribosylation factor-binding protein GGA1-like isoform X2 n=1 Tax=Haliotis rufescens TaxID=6454 RepID=UPI001EAF9946|nr:ADP-ribosylation factor-binding protein GGA1-like isoform X2 [Haliotis rufescens]